jgi:hypothetical protein
MEEKKVCLIGTAPASMMLAPYDNPEWTIWTCSPGTIGVPRSDRHFELHRWEPSQTWFSPGYVEWCKQHPEIMLQAPVKDVKNGHVFGWQPLVNKYGPYFFTSSLAWMMAQAFEEGFTKVALYGVDMAATTEYEMQRAGVQYFAMLGAAMGVEVGVPPESDVLRPAPLYGICEGSHVWIKQRARNLEMNQRLQKNRAELAQLQESILFLQGALDDQDWQLHSWFGNIDTQGQFFTAPPDVPALMPKKTNGSGEPVALGTFIKSEPEPRKAKVSTKKRRGRPRA